MQYKRNLPYLPNIYYSLPLNYVFLTEGFYINFQFRRIIQEPVNKSRTKETGASIYCRLQNVKHLVHIFTQDDHLAPVIYLVLNYATSY